MKFSSDVINKPFNIRKYICNICKSNHTVQKLCVIIRSLNMHVKLYIILAQKLLLVMRASRHNLYGETSAMHCSGVIFNLLFCTDSLEMLNVLWAPSVNSEL